jgi:HK97 family phage portal protein
LNPFPIIRRLANMVFRRSPFRIFTFAGSHVDYLSKVGDGTGSSTVTAPLFWVMRTFPEAPPALWQQLENGQEEHVREHPLLRLLQKPNEFYTGVILWMSTVLDWMVDGNAYWLKLRDQDGIVRELWWVPHWLIEPRSERDDTFITHYEYRPGTEALNLSPDDVVHFRFGQDSDNPMLGQAPLKSVLREVYTDDEAASFTASLLRNMGVPGLIVSPEKGVSIPDEQAEETKKDLMRKFVGDRRGEPIVMTGATQIAQFGFSPEQLLLRELRRIPEERVTAVLGIPAIVAVHGDGLDRSTFTNMGEAREAAYEAGIIPMQRIMADTIRFHLLTDFEADVYTLRFGFDLSKVRVLQEDLYRQAERHSLLYKSGIEMRSEARRGMALDVDEARDEVFFIPLNTTVVPASESHPVQPPQLVAAFEQLALTMGESEQRHAADLADVKALVSEHREPMEIHNHLSDLPAPIIYMDAPPPAEIHVTPEITLQVPKRQVVVRRDNGTETTYEEE